MENKTVGMIGMIIVAFITILVGVILFTATAQEIGKTTNTVTIDVNITVPANAGVYNFTDYRALSSVVITNASGLESIAAGNYTIANNQLKDGALVTTLTVDDAEYASMSWNVAATAQPLTYIANSGARSMIGIILIFLALAIAIVALLPVLRNGALDLMGV